MAGMKEVQLQQNVEELTNWGVVVGSRGVPGPELHPVLPFQHSPAPRSVLWSSSPYH